MKAKGKSFTSNSLFIFRFSLVPVPLLLHYLHYFLNCWYIYMLIMYCFTLH